MYSLLCTGLRSRFISCPRHRSHCRYLIATNDEQEFGFRVIIVFADAFEKKRRKKHKQKIEFHRNVKRQW